MGLEELENSYPQKLSGGMKQRFAIVRALVNKPRDPIHGRALRHLSARQLSEGKKTGDFEEVIAAIALDSIREIVARTSTSGWWRDLVGWWSGEP